jgi:hypothetical protein
VFLGNGQLRDLGSPDRRRRGLARTNFIEAAPDVRGHSAHLRGAAGRGGNRLADDERRADHAAPIGGRDLPRGRLGRLADLVVVRAQARRKRSGSASALGALFWVGVAVAAYAAVFLVRFRPVAEIAGHSIRYDYVSSGDGPSHLFYLLAYAVPTVVPFFVSTVSLARTIGMLLVVSLVTSAVVQRDALTSVWCFFAAMLSGLILVAIAREQSARSLVRPIPEV